MTPLEVAACAGSALLVVTAALPCLSTAKRGVTLLTLTVSIGLGAAFVHWAVKRADYMPSNHVSRLVRYGREQLTKANESPPENLVIIEGGSYSSHAIDGKLLRIELAKLGYHTRVLQMSLGAGNHFERHRVFSDILEQVPLAARGKKQDAHVVFLAEVHSTYDRLPLAQLDENPDTDRTYHYMTPANAAYGLWSIVDDAWSDGEDIIPAEEAKLLWTAARHTMINAFNVGVAARVAPMERIRAHGGYRTGTIDKGYRYAGLAGTLAVAQAPLGAGESRPIPSWLFSVREARLKALFGDRIDRWMYFSVPSTKVQHATWTRSFCRVATEPCFGVDDAALIRELDQRPYWQDTGHMTTVGSRVFTRWFARRLALEKVLIPSTKPKTPDTRVPQVGAGQAGAHQRTKAHKGKPSKSKSASKDKSKSGKGKQTSKKKRSKRKQPNKR